MKEKIIIIGGGGHAKVLASIIKKIDRFEIIGYTDYKDNGPLLGISYYGDDDTLHTLITNNRKCAAVIGIGYVEISELRNKIFKRLKKAGFSLPAIISPTAIINEDVLIGEGSVVFDSVTVNSGTKIGRGVILNTGCIVEHDCIIDDFVHIGPGASLSGGVKICRNSFIGLNSSIIQGIYITEKCLIGSGSVIIKDCKEKGIYIGNPGRSKN